ncbi:MAG: AMP-binding protein, partial [Promethearchaeota archaeon]
MKLKTFVAPDDRPFFGKYWPMGVPHELIVDLDMNMRDLLKNTTASYPDKPALWFQNSWMTYKQLLENVDRFTTALYKIGVRKGDTVALHMPNCFQYVIGYYAIMSLGAIVTGINPTYVWREILHQIELTDAKYIVVLDGLFTTHYKPILEQRTFKKIIITHLFDLVDSIPENEKQELIKAKKIPYVKIDHVDTIEFLDLLKTQPEVPEITIDSENDIAIYLMTGGTTGVSKAAELTHLNIISNALQFAETLNNQPDEKTGKNVGLESGYITCLPLYHSFAMTCLMNTGIYSGGWLVLFAKPPNPADLIKQITELPDYNGFVYAGAEILFQYIAELPQEIIDKYPLNGRLRKCISGASTLHEYVRKPFEEKTKA